MKTKLFFMVTFLSVLSICNIAYPQAATQHEEVTLTTYYPAPYGDYTELTVSGNAASPALDVTPTLTATANNDVLTALRINPTFNDGGFFNVRHNGLIIQNGNVGIGTMNPLAKLHIAGNPGVDGIRFPDDTVQTTAATGVIRQIRYWNLGALGLQPGVNHLLVNKTINVTQGGSRLRIILQGYLFFWSQGHNYLLCSYHLNNLLVDGGSEGNFWTYEYTPPRAVQPPMSWYQDKVPVQVWFITNNTFNQGPHTVQVRLEQWQIANAYNYSAVPAGRLDFSNSSFMGTVIIEEITTS